MFCPDASLRSRFNYFTFKNLKYNDKSFKLRSRAQRVINNFKQVISDTWPRPCSAGVPSRTSQGGRRRRAPPPRWRGGRGPPWGGGARARPGWTRTGKPGRKDGLEKRKDKNFNRKKYCGNLFAWTAADVTRTDYSSKTVRRPTGNSRIFQFLSNLEDLRDLLREVGLWTGVFFGILELAQPIFF